MTSPIYNICTRCGRHGHCAASCTAALSARLTACLPALRTTLAEQEPKKMTPWELTIHLIKTAPTSLIEEHPYSGATKPNRKHSANQRGQFKNPRVRAIVLFFYQNRNNDAWFTYLDVRAAIPFDCEGFTDQCLATDLSNLANEHCSILERKANPAYKHRVQAKWFYRFNRKYPIELLEWSKHETLSTQTLPALQNPGAASGQHVGPQPEKAAMAAARSNHDQDACTQRRASSFAQDSDAVVKT
jgi:hypothetical protein